MGNSLIIKHRITLDLLHRGAQITVPVSKCDRLSQQLIVTFRHGTETLELPDGTRAAIAIHNNLDDAGVLDSCIVDHVNNAVIYTFSAVALAVAGNIACDIIVSNADGGVVGSPRFNLFVEETGADITAEQLMAALQGEASSWQFVNDFYRSVESVDARIDEKIETEIEQYDETIKEYGGQTYAPYQSNADESYDAIPILQKDGTYSKRNLNPNDTSSGSVIVRGANGYAKSGSQPTDLSLDSYISRGLAEKLFLESRVKYTNKGSYYSAAEPASKEYSIGDYLYNTLTQKYYVWNGMEWKARTSEPSGYINDTGLDCPLVIGANDYVKFVSLAEMLKNAKLAISLNSSTYVMKIALNVGNTVVSQASVDLPLEEMITDISTVDEDTIRLTLKSGKNVDVSVAKLVSGLATKEDFGECLTKDTSKSDVNRVYAVDVKGNQIRLECSTGRRPNSLPIRDKSSFNFGVGNPVNDMQCVPLGFGDIRYGFREETDALKLANECKVYNSDVKHDVISGDRSPVSTGALFNALVDAKTVINGIELAAGTSYTIPKDAYGEYTIYGNDVTVSYDINSTATPISYTGKIHQLTLYTTKLYNGSTGTKIFHACTSSQTVMGVTIPKADTAFGNLSKSDITVTANQKAFIVPKKAISGVESVTVTSPELEYELSSDGKYYTCVGLTKTPASTDIVIASHLHQVPVKAIGQTAFNTTIGRTMTSIKIPDTIQSIGWEAFCYCTTLSEIIIPDSVTEIADGAFVLCKNLKYVKCPNKLQSINPYVFEGCHSLTHIDIPDSVIEICIGAFYECRSLRRVKLPPSIKTMHHNVFIFCDNLKDIYVPWGEGEVENAPWGAENATVHYNSEV